MDKLFDNTPDETIAAMVDTPMLASGAQVRALVSYSFKEETVRRWPQGKAEAVLRKCKADEGAARNQANGTANLIDFKDGVTARGQPSRLERISAAQELERSKAGGPDELLQTMMYTLYVCSDDELKRLGGYLQRLWTAPPPEPVQEDEGYAYADAGPDPGGTAGAEAAGGGDGGGDTDFGFVFTPDNPY